MNMRPRRREDPDITLIPLIDVLLVLLIFFMVSTTFNQEGRVKVQLPQSSDNPVPNTAHEPLVVGVTAEGTYRVNEHTLINSSPETLRAARSIPARSAAFSAATAPATPEFASATTGFAPSRCFQAPSTASRPDGSPTISTSAAHNCSPKRSWINIRTASLAAQRPSSQS